jgi:hypothetical protein
MSYRGTIKNGVVVLEPGADLAEGTPGRIEPEILPATGQSPPGEVEADPLLSMLQHAGPTGIPDLAMNADHYLYGHPKVTDAR